MNTILIIGAVILVAAIVTVFLTIKLQRGKKKDILADAEQEFKDAVLSKQDDLINKTEELIKDLPPVNGPDAVEPPDLDNPYSVTNNEPLVIAEKTTIDEILDEADKGKIVCPPVVFPTETKTNLPKVKSFEELVEAAKPAKRTRKKKETTKVTKKPAKTKTDKKVEKKTVKKTTKKTTTRKPRTKKEA